ncbi:hypothetical protein QCA50_013756 [Cerrena zonata]|uniref:Uncharacterized protein n=1 Tax=Cerrena zonata TaxID=2478898 RepID=A0AAW0FPV9_9APHY
MSAETSINATSVILDDSSPSIVYSEFWFPQGSGYNRSFATTVIFGDQDPNFNRTVHLTQTFSETALFTFHGTGIEVIGSVGPQSWGGLPVSRYTLDAMPTVDYEAKPSNESFQTNVTFFKSPTLEEGTHTLLITNQPCQDLPSSCKLLLDYIIWTDPSRASSTLSSTSTAPETTTSVIPIAGSTAKPSVGILVGPVVGGVVLLVLIGLVFWSYRRRRRRSRGVSVVDIFDDSHDPSPRTEMLQNHQTEQLLSQHSVDPYPLSPYKPSHTTSRLLEPTYTDNHSDFPQSTTFATGSSAGPSSAVAPSRPILSPVPQASKGQLIQQQQTGPAVYEDAPPAYSPTPPPAS